ncbi:MAG: 30S ribosomal protein S15 [Nanoarchaeota archaeon]|nr:30S ribosomal protein S15 [Nanoarchaeota archaeon]MBU0977768.1 30S ribosomal protein S15 [Nanoarchaeota archaeon]
MAEKKEESAEKATTKRSAKPNWVKMRAADLEKIVVELGKKGDSPAKIGLILRDQYGVPRAKLLGKKITKILDENGVSYQDDKAIVDKRVALLQSHIGKNKHDFCASRALTKKLWDLYHIKKKQ